MESATLTSKIITIKEANKTTTANGNILIRVKDLQNLTYQIWMTKQDGTQTVAYSALKNLPNDGVGLTVEIACSEQPGNYNGKPVVYRRIVSIKSVVGKAKAINAQSAQQIYKKDDDEKWNRISRGKCKHVFLVEFLKKDMSLADAEPLAEEWAEASMRFLKDEPVPDEADGEADGEAEEEEAPVNEIPF